MLEYIYFVKCPGCEDEHFSFFNEAKDFAMSLLSKKPVITQIEVDRNDFGECVDSCDLGTVWSWEDIMKIDDEPTASVFTKDDLKACTCDSSCGDNCKCGHHHEDPEFAALDNSVAYEGKDLEEELEYEFNPAELQQAKTAAFRLNDVQSLRKDTSLPQIYALYTELCSANGNNRAGINHATQAEDFLGFYNKILELQKNNEVNIFNSNNSTDGSTLVKFKNADSLKKLISESHTENNTVIRTPVPADMSIKDLVEAMEANEDTVECAGCEEVFPKDECFYKEGIGWLCGDCEDSVVKCGWCDELFDKSECRKEVDLGWLCDRCQAGIMSRGEPLTFRENNYWDFLDESFNPNEKVEFNYDGLKVTLQGPKRDVDDWDESEEEVSYTFTKKKDDVATDIWENFIEEVDAKDTEGGLEVLEDDRAWNDFLATHFDGLLDKYYDKLLNYYEDAARKEYEETHSLNEAIDTHDLVELEYPSLTVTLYGPKRGVDDWDEFEHTDSHVFLVPKVEVATAIWENWITEEDVKDVEGGLEALDDDRAWEIFLETHFDSLFEKYNKQILDHFKEEATEDFRERSQEEYGLDKWSAEVDRAYDAWRDEKYFGESFDEVKPFLAESDAEPKKSDKPLADCPECGVSESFDHTTGICSNCGFSI
jgi:hypothetical protein